MKYIPIYESYFESDYTPYTSINLQHEYDKYNKLFFNNELPKVPLKWENNKASSGRVIWLRNRTSGVITFKSLAITHTLEFTYEEVSSVLIHEMIHVWCVSKGFIEENDHGEYFQYKKNMINRELKERGFTFEVSDTDEVSKRKVASHIKSKENLIVLIYKFEKPYAIQLYKKEITKTVLEQYAKYSINWYKDYGYKIVFVYSSNLQLVKYPVKRSLPKGDFVTYPIDETLFSDLEKEKHLAVIDYKKYIERVKNK